VIIHAVEESRRIFERMMSYIIYHIAMSIDIMVFVVLASIDKFRYSCRGIPRTHQCLRATRVWSVAFFHRFPSPTSG